jgi:hypothetical protein
VRVANYTPFLALRRVASYGVLWGLFRFEAATDESRESGLGIGLPDWWPAANAA